MIIIIILTIYNKIVKSDWVSTVLISALIGQYISLECQKVSKTLPKIQKDATQI